MLIDPVGANNSESASAQHQEERSAENMTDHDESLLMPMQMQPQTMVEQRRPQTVQVGDTTRRTDPVLRHNEDSRLPAGETINHELADKQTEHLHGGRLKGIEDNHASHSTANKSIMAKKLAEMGNQLSSISVLTGQDPLLEPVLRAGKLYSIGRKDRSGSVISDMLYAHAFAFAHNVTYAGACFTVKGLPKKDTRHLLQELHWNSILPFACPPGVDSSLNLFKPNATELSPLMLNDDVYRFNMRENYFTPAWRASIQKIVMTEHSAVHSAERRNDKSYEIAVHVRRGDVSPCTYVRRYLHNEHYLKLIDQFTPTPEERENRPVHVTIYSESDSFESFDVFQQRGYTLELDTKDLAVVWKALATADLVILSRSYFSFVPAAVNPNTVVATDFFEFQPLPGWQRVDQALVKETDREIQKMKERRC